MARAGTFEECMFVDVSAGFAEQARRERRLVQFRKAWIKIYVEKFPHRGFRRLTPAQRAHRQMRREEGLPVRSDKSWVFMKKILKDMAWQTYAWHKYTPKCHWTEWIALDPAERDRVSKDVLFDFWDTQDECKLKSTDQLFGVPGSSKELAIVIDD
ncbi:hypothetical protein MD484_g8610, partial [Candolleomyces efflorescens]